MAEAGEQQPPRPLSRRRELVETLIIFAAVTLICALLWQLRRVVPLVARYLHDLIAATFLVVPTLLLWRRDEDFDAYALTVHPVARGLAWFAGVAAIVFPLFAVGFYFYYRVVCGAALAGHAVPSFYRRLCPSFAGSWRRARARIEPWKLAKMTLVQLGVVALPEEYFFRGYLQTRLQRVWSARRRLFGGEIGLALVAAALLFALGHVLVDFNGLRFAVFFPGLVFGWMRNATGSILAPVLFHAASNVVSEALHRAFFG